MCQVLGLVGHERALALRGRMARTISSGRSTICTHPSGRCCCMIVSTCLNPVYASGMPFRAAATFALLGACQ